MPPNEIESVWPPDAELWSLTTPGASIARSRKSRVLSGKDSICLVSINVFTTCSVVSTSGADAATLTVSVRPPTSRENGTATCDAIGNRTSARVPSLNPGIVTVMV